MSGGCPHLVAALIMVILVGLVSLTVVVAQLAVAVAFATSPQQEPYDLAHPGSLDRSPSQRTDGHATHRVR
jgi:hypothetical protein